MDPDVFNHEQLFRVVLQTHNALHMLSILLVDTFQTSAVLYIVIGLTRVWSIVVTVVCKIAAGSNNHFLDLEHHWKWRNKWRCTIGPRKLKLIICCRLIKLQILYYKPQWYWQHNRLVKADPCHLTPWKSILLFWKKEKNLS